MIATKCDGCINSRTVVSENGLHHVCVLSGKKPLVCIATGKYYKPIITSEMVAEKLAESERFHELVRQKILEETSNNG